MTTPADWRAGAFVYSGRPDPSWAVGADQATAWVEAFNGLAPTDRSIPNQSRLGYRGVWLQAPDGRRWNAFLLVAWYERDRRKDSGRELERRLLELGAERLPSGWTTWLELPRTR